MRKKLFWLPCLMFLFGALCASCGSDDNEPTDEPGTGDTDGTEVKNDYTATTKVKTVVVKSEWGWGNDVPVCYEDFNRKYSLCLQKGKLSVLPFTRQGGEWNGMFTANGYQGVTSYNALYVIMEDIGKVSGLSEITRKIELGVSILHYPDAQPKHGYAVTFKTENDELKYLRIFVTDYTLNDNGTVVTVTVQYQLY